MAFKIVRNDITDMRTEAIVNTANSEPIIGAGCDTAIYNAAGAEKLLAYRKEKIGSVPEGEAFITPGFNLISKYIIHVVSPLYIDGKSGEEDKLRSCYRRALSIAKRCNIKSIAIPLISTGSFGYPKEEGLRIAIDEIKEFLAHNELKVYLVVYDDKAAEYAKKLPERLSAYIDRNYVKEGLPGSLGASASTAPMLKLPRNGRGAYSMAAPGMAAPSMAKLSIEDAEDHDMEDLEGIEDHDMEDLRRESPEPVIMSRESPGPVIMRRESPEPVIMSRESPGPVIMRKESPRPVAPVEKMAAEEDAIFEERDESRLSERMRHMSDTFSEYLLYMIKDRGMENADVWKRAIVDKKTFSKIKNNPDYHPTKLTALCLCMGARLNLDEAIDLLARAGYALSPCDKMDIIFSYFIEHKIYDMIELDIQLEEYGLPCIIE